MLTKRFGSPRVSARGLAAVVAGLMAVSGALGAAPGGGQEAGAAKLRRWRDNSGKYDIEASLVQVLADSVQLRRADGKLLTVPLARLSAEDRTYVEGRRNSNPFAVPADADAESKLGSALVVVALTVGDRESSVPGIVFYREGRKSYVTLDAGRLLSAVAGGVAARRSARPASVRFLVESDAGPPRQVAGEFVAAVGGGETWLVAGPAAELPAPVVIPEPAPLREPFPVQLVGFEIDTTVQPPAFARAQAEATVTKVFLTDRGQAYRLQIEGDRVTDVKFGFVVSAADGVLGYFTEPAAMQRDKPGPLSAWPVQALIAFRNPRFAPAGFRPLRGDRDKVEYQFVVFVTDPFHLVRAPRLRLRQLPEGTPPLGFAPANVAAEPLADASEVPLAAGEPAEVVREALGRVVGPAGAVTWVATHATPNPGDVRQIMFRLQMVYKDASGRDIYQPPNDWLYTPGLRMPGRPPPMGAPPPAPGPPAVSMIPGLDGRPLDMPRPAPHPAGGWLLTGDSTRVKEEAATSPPRDAPSPRAEERPLGGTAFTAGGLRGVPLNLVAQVPGRFDRKRAPMCFAPAGDWLYLVDGNSTLRKIRTRDLTEVAALPLGAECEDLAYSPAGLIVPLTKANRLWVVDANSLQVRREVPLDGVRLVAASPAGSLGFALAMVANPDLPAAFGGCRLAMLDFATGRRLHELSNQYRGRGGAQPLTIDNQVVLEAGCHNMEMTQDGKYLFLGARSITRFRIDGRDLIYEEKGPSLENGHTTHFVLSGDGTKTALPTGGGNGGGSYTIAVYDGKKLSRQLLVLPNGPYPCALGFDPQSGQMYAPNSDCLQVFAPQGGKLSESPLQDRDVRRILVHPQGGRFVAWSGTKVTWYEVQP